MKTIILNKKIKNSCMLLVTTILFVSQNIYAQIVPTCYSCAVPVLNVSTGINANSNLVGIGGMDEFWTVSLTAAGASASTGCGGSINGNQEHCTKVNNSNIYSSTISKAIRHAACLDMPICGTCTNLGFSGNGNFYNLFRRFDVCKDMPIGVDAKITFKADCADRFDEIDFKGGGCNGNQVAVHLGTYFCNSSNQPLTTFFLGNLKAGTYSIQIKMYVTGALGGGTNPLLFQLDGSIFSSDNNSYFVDNKHSVFSHSTMAPDYTPYNDIGGYGQTVCKEYSLPMQSGTTLCDDKVSLFAQGGGNSVASAFDASNATVTMSGVLGTNYTKSGTNPINYNFITPGTYTVTVANGLTGATTSCIKTAIYKTKKVVINSITASVTCLAVGGTSVLTCNAITVSPDIINYKLNAGAWQTPNTFTVSVAGNYTVTAKNIITNCTATSLISIGNVILANIKAEGATCFPTIGGVMMYAYPFNAQNIGQYTYTWAPMPNATPVPNSNKANANTAGMYNVTISDIYGCTGNSNIYFQPTFTFTLSANPPCISNQATTTATITATSTMTMQPNWFTITPQNLVGALPQQSPTALSFVVNIPTPIIKFKKANGCSITQEISIVKCNDCNNILPNATQFGLLTTATTFTNNSLPTTPIYFTGDVIVNSNFVMNNNQTIFIASNCKFIIQPGASLTITNCSIQSCGDRMWDGIYYSAGASNLLIYGSQIRDMENGINLNSLSAATIHQNIFVNSGEQSILVKTIASPTASANKYITGNVFTSSTLPLKLRNSTAMAGTPDKPRMGIQFLDCLVASVGLNNLGASISNTFSEILCGIRVVLSNTSTLAGTYNLENNNFTNINNIYATPGVLNLNARTTNPYTNYYGTGIFANIANATSSNAQINIIGNTSTAFTNVDKAVVTDNATPIVKNLQINNCLLGVFCKDHRRSMTIQNCVINNTHIGIQAVSSTINKLTAIYIIGNNINNNTSGIFTTTIAKKFPMGIDILQETSTGTPPFIKIDNNIVHLKSPKGVGIKLDGVNFINGSGVPSSFTKNECFLDNVNASAASGWSATINGPKIGELGYWFNACKNLNAVDNLAYGNHDASHSGAFWRSIHASAGMLAETNVGLGLRCNNITRTVNGLYIIGDNQQLASGNTNIAYNNFNANYYPWFCADVIPGVNFGTLGDVGNATFDAGNQFVNNIDLRRVITGDPINIYRNTAVTTGLTGIITTNASLTTLLNSKSLLPLTNYTVTISTIPINDPCANLANKVAMSTDGNTIDETEREDREDDIIAEDVAFTPNQELMHWMNDWKLYATLDMDANRRQNHANLMAFYTATQATNIGKLYAMDKQIAALQIDSPENAQVWHNNLYNAMYTAEQIITNNDWEQAYKTIQGIKLQSLENGQQNLTASDLETITEIANACIYEKALAVLEARALYTSIYPGVHFNDYYICSPNASRSAEPITETIEDATDADFEVFVYPVPANDIINFEYLLPNGTGTLYIYNAMGQVIYTTPLASGIQKTSVPTATMANGIYNYKVVFANKLAKLGKFNVIHE